ncbi:MAG: hypothetical protein ACTH3E_06090 [Psychroflexus halocasei]
MKMKEDDIRELLKLYDLGETTIEQEETLRDFFLKNTDIPEDLEIYQQMFVGFQEAKKEDYDEFKFEKPKSKKLTHQFYKLAAVLIVLIASSFYLNSHYQDYKQKEEARLVFKQTKEVLDKLSFEMNKASSNLKYINKLEETKKRLIQ